MEVEEEDTELAEQIAAVHAARVRVDEERSAANLEYCAEIAKLVALLVARRRGNPWGAKARAAELLGMSAQNVGAMLRRLPAPQGAPAPLDDASDVRQ